jgi:hypothetical protein
MPPLRAEKFTEQDKNFKLMIHVYGAILLLIRCRARRMPVAGITLQSLGSKRFHDFGLFCGTSVDRFQTRMIKPGKKLPLRKKGVRKTGQTVSFSLHFGGICAKKIF